MVTRLQQTRCGGCVSKLFCGSFTSLLSIYSLKIIRELSFIAHRWYLRSAAFLGGVFVDVMLGQVQIDEFWSFIRKKRKFDSRRPFSGSAKRTAAMPKGYKQCMHYITYL